MSNLFACLISVPVVRGWLTNSDAISHWDDLTDAWRVEKGTWTVSIGIDAQTFYEQAEAFEIEREMPWVGL